MMTLLKKSTWLVVTTCFLIISPFARKANAQRVAYRQANEYQRLAYMSQHPPIFFNAFTLPGLTKGKELLTITFNINYKRLTFTRVNNNSDQGRFYSPTGLIMDLFHSRKEWTPPNNKLPKGFYPGRHSKRDKIDVSGLTSIAHTAWQDTAYASDYVTTKTADRSLNGSMQVQVKPGNYIYLIQPKKNKGAQGFSKRIHVSPYNKLPVDNVLFARSVNSNTNPTRLRLMNLGHNVLFGEDFYVFIHLPNYKKDTSYLLKIEKVQNKGNKSQTVNTIYKQPVSAKNILTNIRPVLHSNEKGIYLTLNHETNGFTYALIQIPNGNFDNSPYKLTLINKTTSKTTAVDFYQSYWKNMPASLLSLNVAIDMMKYIAPDQKIDAIKNGSFQERKEKFKKFWEAKDPTPDTPFNELEAEYYARIDSAYQKFTTQKTPGYESSRGKVYILYGPPQHKQRSYPPNGPTTIVWTYPSRKFIFQAVSDLGDFKLVNKIQ